MPFPIQESSEYISFWFLLLPNKRCKSEYSSSNLGGTTQFILFSLLFTYQSLLTIAGPVALMVGIGSEEWLYKWKCLLCAEERETSVTEASPTIYLANSISCM